MDITSKLALIMNKDRNETFDESTDSLEALRDYLGTVFAALSPRISPWFLGECDAAMVASTTDLLLSNLAGAGLPDNILNDNFYVQVIYNADNPGAAPEGEIRLVTDFTEATGLTVCDAFSANVEAGDLVAVIHEALIGPELNLISTLVRAIFDIVNAGLVTTETGGTLTTDGAEQNVYINNDPAGVYEPLVVQIDFSNQAAGDTVIVREYYRITDGGGWIEDGAVAYAGIQATPLKDVELKPNRFGVKVTMERTAGGAADYDWTAVYRG